MYDDGDDDDDDNNVHKEVLVLNLKSDNIVVPQLESMVLMENLQSALVYHLDRMESLVCDDDDVVEVRDLEDLVLFLSADRTAPVVVVSHDDDDDDDGMDIHCLVQQEVTGWTGYKTHRNHILGGSA